MKCAIALNCVDHRLAVDKATIREQLGVDRVWTINAPGTVIGITSQMPGNLGILDQISLVINAVVMANYSDEVTEIVIALYSHEDCGAYGGTELGNRQQQLDHHRSEHTKATDEIVELIPSGVNHRIVGYFIESDGGDTVIDGNRPLASRVTYEPVTV